MQHRHPFFRVFSAALAAGFVLVLAACGQNSSFLEQTSTPANGTSDAMASNKAAVNSSTDGSASSEANSECLGASSCGDSDQTSTNSPSGSTSTTDSTTTGTTSTTSTGTSTTGTSTTGTSTTGTSTTTTGTTTTSTPPSTSIKTLDFGNLWSAGDDGSYFYLNLDTGVWDWKSMTVYNPNYDSTRCQDYVGLIGSFDITNRAGVATTANVNMDWRFNPTCTTLPKEFVGNPALPGTWGTFVNLQSASIVRTAGDGIMKITQQGRYLRFDVYHSLAAKVTVTFSN